MNIHEYQAKEVLKKYGVPTSHGVVALRAEEIDDLIKNFAADIYVVKAQIHAGGRGKAGGVRVVRNKEEARSLAHDMYGKTLVTHQTGPAGQVVKRVYIESVFVYLYVFFLLLSAINLMGLDSEFFYLYWPVAQTNNA